MALVHRHRGEPAVEQMSPPATAGIDEVGPPAVRRAQGQAQAVPGLRAEDQVNVVGHQTPGPDGDRMSAHLLGQHVAVDVLVAVLEKDRLAPVAPRGHMMRKAGNDDAGEARHGGDIARAEQKGNIAPVPLFLSLIPQHRARAGDVAVVDDVALLRPVPPGEAGGHRGVGVVSSCFV